MMRRHISNGLLATCVLIPCLALGASGLPSTDTATFLNGRGWKGMYNGKRLVAMFGPGINNNTASPAPQFVNSFATDSINLKAFAIQDDENENATLALHESRLLNSGRIVYRYNQEVNGVRVYGTSVNVVASTEGTISFIGLNTISPPYPSDFPSVVYDEEAARGIIQGEMAFPEIESFNEGQLVAIKDSAGSLRKVWHIGGWGEGKDLQFFVDAHDGSIVAVSDALQHDVPVSGQVKGEATQGLRIYNGTNTIVEVGLPSVEVRSTDQSTPPAVVHSEYACPNPDDNAPPCTDGSYAFSGTAGNDIRITLDGPWAKIRSCECQTTTGDFARVDCIDSVKSDECTTWEKSSSITSPETIFSPIFDATTSQQYRIAQVNAFIAAEKAHNWFKSRLPSTALVPCINDEPIPACADIAGVNCKMCTDSPIAIGVNCKKNGGFYSVNQFGIAMGDAGDVLYNWSAGDTIAHEYAHFVHHMIDRDYVVDPNLDAFREGVADTYACFLYDDPCRAKGGLVGHPNDCTRHLDEANVLYYAPLTQLAHYRGLALAGAFWDLRTELGPYHCNIETQTTCTSSEVCTQPGDFCNDRLVEELFVDFLFVTDSNLDATVLYEVLAADDDDDNILNGTPNDDAIYSAFGLHGWENGSTEPSVNWDILGTNPVAGTPNDCENCDYIVDQSVIPPKITLISTSGGTPTTQIRRWRIGRRHASTGQALDIWAIESQWESGVADVLVVVGKDPDDIAAEDTDRVRGVGFIDIAAPSGHYSNVQVHLEGGIADIVRCKPNESTSLGGRLVGDVPGDIGRIHAYAIGTGSANIGKLDSLGSSTGASLVKHPEVSSTEKSKLLLGAVREGGLIESTGGDIAGDILVRGDCAGSIHAGDFDILGNIVTGGLFTGDLCGDNLEADVPQSIKDGVVFGPGGSICWDVKCQIDPEATPEERYDFPKTFLLPETPPVSKSRFITLNIDGESDSDVGIRVMLSSLHHVDPPYGAAPSIPFTSRLLKNCSSAPGG